MLVARELAGLPEVEDAAVVMGTEANKAILREAGLLTDDAAGAGPNDLLIAVRASAGVTDRALVNAERLLSSKREAGELGDGGGIGSAQRPRTLHAAIGNNPGANLAVISVAGRYAVAEAWDALHHGLHVLLFSDNVSLEDEVALKQYASQAGLLLMGPGAGTAFLNGAALGFANAVPHGPVGIISAAGTGAATLLAKLGTASPRDRRRWADQAEVGGLMTWLPQAWQPTRYLRIVLVSKPPHRSVVSVLTFAASKAAAFLGAG
jgi:succinyl-CoA synthetase alpha subunit